MSLNPATVNFTGTNQVRRGTDWFRVITINESGSPKDFSGYNEADPVSEWKNVAPPTGTISGCPQPTVRWINGGTGGQILFLIPAATSTAATVTTGVFDVEVIQDSTAGTFPGVTAPTISQVGWKDRILTGTWAMDQDITLT